MTNTEKGGEFGRLYEVLAKMGTAADVEKMLLDLCTYTEIEQMAGRLKCAELLLDGNTYNKIMDEMDISSATLSRVSRCLRHGSGGYSDVLKQLKEGEK